MMVRSQEKQEKAKMRGIPWYTLVWGARYTLGARYLSKNTVILMMEAVGLCNVWPFLANYKFYTPEDG